MTKKVELTLGLCYQLRWVKMLHYVWAEGETKNTCDQKSKYKNPTNKMFLSFRETPFNGMVQIVTILAS